MISLLLLAAPVVAFTVGLTLARRDADEEFQALLGCWHRSDEQWAVEVQTHRQELRTLRAALDAANSRGGQ
jgi:hypothetical protein